MASCFLHWKNDRFILVTDLQISIERRADRILLSQLETNRIPPKGKHVDARGC